MGYKKTKETLDTLYSDLKEHYHSAQESIEQEDFNKASVTLAAALGLAEQQLERAREEELLPEPDLIQEHVSKSQLDAAYAHVDRKVSVLQNLKISCDKLYSKSVVGSEYHEEKKRIEKIKQEIMIAEQYERSFAHLELLKKQPQPFVGVADELNLFLKQVKEMQANNSMSRPELTQIMNATYDRLTGGSKEVFDKLVDRMQAQHSIPLKILGATLALLGAALVASAVLFAPAVLTAAGTGLATAYLATAAVTVGSSALSIGGAACFFHKTQRMELTDTAHDLGHENLEDKHYEPVGAR